LKKVNGKRVYSEAELNVRTEMEYNDLEIDDQEKYDELKQLQSFDEVNREWLLVGTCTLTDGVETFPIHWESKEIAGTVNGAIISMSALLLKDELTLTGRNELDALLAKEGVINHA
jgi:hypothetical protein